MNAIMIAVLLAAAPNTVDASAAAPAPAAAAATNPDGAPALPVRTIKMTVTKKGFVPAQLKVKKGQPLHLLITRKTDETCATEITIENTKISKQVAVDFTPPTSGEIRYACSMGMVSGVLVVE
jgi:plastocyanin domain-containing protein